MEATDKKGKTQTPHPKLLLNGLLGVGAVIIGLMVLSYLASLLNGQSRQIGSPVSLGQANQTAPATDTEPAESPESKTQPKSLRQERWASVQIASANLDAIILDMDAKLNQAMAQRWIAHATSQCAKRKGCTGYYQILTAEYGDRLRKLQRLTRTKAGQAQVEQLRVSGPKVAQYTDLIQELKAIKTALAAESPGAPVSLVDTAQINQFAQEFANTVANFDATPDGLIDDNATQTETQP